MIVIGVLVILVLLLIAQFGPSLVRGETVYPASPRFHHSGRTPGTAMIAAARVAALDDLRGVLGNDVAAAARDSVSMVFEVPWTVLFGRLIRNGVSSRPRSGGYWRFSRNPASCSWEIAGQVTQRGYNSM
jgi:hypothetical protein